MSEEKPTDKKLHNVFVKRRAPVETDSGFELAQSGQDLHSTYEYFCRLVMRGYHVRWFYCGTIVADCDGSVRNLEDFWRPHISRIAENMIKDGGAFVRHLGQALQVADKGNARRIREAFLDTWLKYFLYPNE